MKLTKSEKNFIDRLYKKNRRVTAQYLALYTECFHMKKVMVTLTPKDGKIDTLVQMRKIFFNKLNNYKRNKNGDLTIKYFSNIEFTKKNGCYQHVHMHIQLFYSVNKTPIEKAYRYLINSKKKNTKMNNITYAEDNDKRFNYVIKDYKSFNYDLELVKCKHKNIKYVTSSQKSISNKLVKFLFKILIFKTKNRYKEILDWITDGTICLLKNTNKINEEKKFVKNHLKKHKFNKTVKVVCQRKIGIYKLYLFCSSSKQRALKIKKYITKRRTIKNKTKLYIQPRKFILVEAERFFDYVDFEFLV